MATKTKTAKPKARTRTKSKPKAKPSPDPKTNPDPEANSSPEVDHQMAVYPENPGNPDVVTRPDSPIGRTRTKRSGFSAREAAGILKILADETRITIVTLLGKSPGIIVGDIVKNCPTSQPAVSHHLALLRHSGIVYDARDGKRNRYRLTDKGQIAARLLATMLED